MEDRTIFGIKVGISLAQLYPNIEEIPTEKLMKIVEQIYSPEIFETKQAVEQPRKIPFRLKVKLTQTFIREYVSNSGNLILNEHTLDQFFTRLGKLEENAL